MSETATQQRDRRKVMQGIVVSDKMGKTIVVLVEDRVKHPFYGKVMAKSPRIEVHDEDNTAGIGDRVRVMEICPLSAQGRWRLVKIIERTKRFARKWPIPAGAGLSASNGGYDQPMGVLIVDDEAELTDAIATYLQVFELETEYVVDGAFALVTFDARPPKLVVLDMNLPDVNGFEVYRAMRAKGDIPILFLSTRGSDDDRILALGFGNDDYVRKPVSLVVLLAKVRRMLDRLGQSRGFRDDWLVVNDDAGRVFVGGAEIKLTAIEHRLLRHLVANRGRIVPKGELFTAIWDSPLTGGATLSVHVRRLRTHTESDPADPRYVKTVWRRGYISKGGR